jgi:hypothetical protein
MYGKWRAPFCKAIGRCAQEACELAVETETLWSSKDLLSVKEMEAKRAGNQIEVSWSGLDRLARERAGRCASFSCRGVASPPFPLNKNSSSKRHQGSHKASLARFSLKVVALILR